jgi:ATP-dependent exoDNAse (exonuclease V) alpha subunit
VVRFDEFPPSYKASIRSSPLWQKIRVLALMRTIRLAVGTNGKMSPVNTTFAATLLKIGEGKFQKNDFGMLNLKGVPHTNFERPADGEKILIDFVYAELLQKANSTTEENSDYLNERCILVPLSRDVRALNKKITRKLPGKLILSKSIDLPDPKGIDTLPEECLNKLSISGLPEHLIYLKVGMPVVVMRNLYIKQGVCNGSRMVVLSIGAGFLMGKLISGPKSGTVVLIPKIKIHNKISVRAGLLFYRYQFPVAPAYAMSVNKTQGQTFRRVSVYLETDVFAHGQLYVALSRVTEACNVLVAKPSGRRGVVNVCHKKLFKV